LNYGAAEHSINIFEKLNPSTLSKGLVISLNSFEGRIDISNSTFNKNLVFYPSAAFSNAPRFNSTVFNPDIHDFMVKGE
jgi:hypothetical protein